MSHEDTRKLIESILLKEFSPKMLEVIDNSQAHKNHAAAKENPAQGHFLVHMQSDKFKGIPLVKRHRMVYKHIGDLMNTKIHALSLNLSE